MARKLKEKGAAQINIELSDGKVTVRHTDQDGSMLMEAKAYTGYWDNLWNAIEGNNGENAKITFRADPQRGPCHHRRSRQQRSR